MYFSSDAGQQVKKKPRIAVKGHPGNMTKGVHFNETFAATPKENSSGMLCGLAVLLNLTRLCFDITKAYCWAEFKVSTRSTSRNVDLKIEGLGPRL